MFLARKITRAKWLQRPELAQGEIAADAVTADLRTNGNALSFWRCDTGAEDQVEPVALAMAASGDRIDKLDVVWIAERHFAADGQTWEDTDGRTPVAELRKRHVDLQRLDYVRLGNVARHVAAAIESERYLRLSRRRVKMLLVAAVRRDQCGDWPILPSESATRSAALCTPADGCGLPPQAWPANESDGRPIAAWRDKPGSAAPRT